MSARLPPPMLRRAASLRPRPPRRKLHFWLRLPVTRGSPPPTVNYCNSTTRGSLITNQRDPVKRIPSCRLAQAGPCLRNNCIWYLRDIIRPCSFFCVTQRCFVHEKADPSHIFLRDPFSRCGCVAR